jgi:delta1-piperideine-2-carboxylate reductase
MTKKLTLDEVSGLAFSVLTRNGVDEDGAKILADRIVEAERDGTPSHGLAMLPDYVSSVESKWANGAANPTWEMTTPSLLSVDGDNGFAPVALTKSLDAFEGMVRKSGVAALLLRNSHHISALRSDVERLALTGFIAITCVTTRCWMVPWAGNRKIFGTNPMAFACPRNDQPPIVWDQAASVVAISAIRMAAEKGEVFEQPIGVDSLGQPTCDANLAAESNTVLPFGQHKGSAIALMIEILAGALTGGHFSLEDKSPELPGAASANGGQIVIAFDPSLAYGEHFCERLEPLLVGFESNGSARIPGDGRFERSRKVIEDGVSVSPKLWQTLQSLT